MTTISYKDGIFAYDSRIRNGDLITDDDYDKCHVVNNVVFFLTGVVSDYSRLIDSYFGKDVGKDVECRAFVLDGGNFYECAVDPATGVWKLPLRLDSPRAIGSGSYFALTAMDMGADAIKAVEMAALRDSATGGKIRTYKI